MIIYYLLLLHFEFIIPKVINIVGYVMSQHFFYLSWYRAVNKFILQEDYCVPFRMVQVALL